MRKQRFQVTEDGQVWETARPWALENGKHADTDYQWVGHISCLMHDGTAIGRAVQEWWRARLTSDEPIEDFTPPRRRKARLIQVPASALAVAAAPDQEQVEALVEELVAD